GASTSAGRQRAAPPTRVAGSTRSPTPRRRRLRRRLRAASDLRRGGELAAGGPDIPSARKAHRRRDTGELEIRPESSDSLPRRAFVKARRVVRDEVHLEMVAAEYVCQPPC